MTNAVKSIMATVTDSTIIHLVKNGRTLISGSFVNINPFYC